MNEKPVVPRKWWVARHGEALGPFGTGILLAEIRSGRLALASLAVPVGESEWRPLVDWPEFSEFSFTTATSGVCSEPPPCPANRDSGAPLIAALPHSGATLLTESGRRHEQRSVNLTIAFGIAVGSVVVALDVIPVVFLGSAFLSVENLLFVLGALSVILVPAAWKWFELNGSSAFIAAACSSREVPADTTDPQLVRLRRTVERLARRVGIPTPAAHLIPGEGSINAFAVGLSREEAVVGVSQGALEKLDEVELEGVVAHEVSHLVNGDSALHARLVAMLFGLTVLIVVAGFGILFGEEVMRRRSARSSRDERAAQVFLGIGLMVLAALVGLIGGMGWISGRLLTAGVSRQREFLADAGAAQITGSPAGLLSALRKIAGESTPTTAASAHGGIYRHIFLSSSWGGSWFDSHPPIGERIAALEGLVER